MALDYGLGIIQFIHFYFKTVYYVSDPLYTMSMVHTRGQGVDFDAYSTNS